MTQKPKVGLKRRGEKGFWKIFSAELKSILFRVCFLKPSIENLRDYNNRGMADCNIRIDFFWWVIYILFSRLQTWKWAIQWNLGLGIFSFSSIIKITGTNKWLKNENGLKIKKLLFIPNTCSQKSGIYLRMLKGRGGKRCY